MISNFACGIMTALNERVAELEEKLFKQSQENKEDVSIAIEIILEKDAKIAELMARIAKAELAFAVVEGRIAELEKGISHMLTLSRNGQEFPPHLDKLAKLLEQAQ